MVLAALPVLINAIVVVLSGRHSVLRIVACATPSCFSKVEESCSQAFFIFAEAA